MSARIAFAIAALVSAGCVRETTRNTVRPGGEDLRFSTANEKAARETVTRYFELLAEWNLPAAYDLLSVAEQHKISFEDYRKACENDREVIVAMARRAKVAYTGEGGPDPATRKPYVMVLVTMEGHPNAKYGAMPESGAWRVILTDASRVDRAQ